MCIYGYRPNLYFLIIDDVAAYSEIPSGNIMEKWEHARMQGPEGSHHLLYRPENHLSPNYCLLTLAMASWHVTQCPLGAESTSVSQRLISACIGTWRGVSTSNNCTRELPACQVVHRMYVSETLLERPEEVWVWASGWLITCMGQTVKALCCFASKLSSSCICKSIILYIIQFCVMYTCHDSAFSSPRTSC